MVLTSSVSCLAPALPGPQAGLIRTDSSDYFIEPLERGQQEEEAGGRTHVVYRREAVQQEWAEPHGDLHNEGRLWAGAPGVTCVPISGVISGLSFQYTPSVFSFVKWAWVITSGQARREAPVD